MTQMKYNSTSQWKGAENYFTLLSSNKHHVMLAFLSAFVSLARSDLIISISSLTVENLMQSLKNTINTIFFFLPTGAFFFSRASCRNKHYVTILGKSQPSSNNEHYSAASTTFVLVSCLSSGFDSTTQTHVKAALYKTSLQ